MRAGAALVGVTLPLAPSAFVAGTPVAMPAEATEIEVRFKWPPVGKR
jgi:hypothetical protein